MTMAIGYARGGDPAEVLAPIEVPAPAPPGRGQVQIEVHAVPLHPGDLFGVTVAAPDPGRPRVAGLEATGVVVAAGDAVTTPLPGTRVTVFPHQGAWARRINVAAELAVPVPDSVSEEVAAQVVCNPLTALLLYRACLQHFPVGFDGVVLNNAANSSVARLFTAGALHHQIPAINIVRSAARAQQLTDRYPGVPAVSTDAPDWVGQVRAAAAGRPIPVALDPVGGTIAADLISLLSPGGTLIVYGQIADEAIPLRAGDLLGGEIGLRGLTIGRWLSGVASERRASDIASAAAIAAARPEEFDVAAVYTADQIAQAVQHVRRPGRIGTVLLRL